MATTYDKASLVMIPSGVKESKLYSIKPTSGDGDFTFSRGTDTATRVNASGLIEKERSNQILQSNTFTTTWSTTRASFVSGQAGYDGTNDAWAFVDDTNNSTHLSAQSLSLGASVATFSIYAKAGDVDFLAVRFEGSAVDYAYFNLASGTLGTIDSDYIEARITDVGGGWYRCEATRVLAASGNQVVLLAAQANNDPTYAGAGTTAIYIQDAQVEYGLVATSPAIETTTAAVYEGITDNLPRLDYSGGASCPSLLLEPSRTNIVDDSEYFEGSGWISNNVVLTANNSISPEGVQNAYLIQADSVNNVHRVYDSLSVVSGTTYTFSVFAKAGNNNFVQIYAGTGFDGSGNVYANFDLSDGTKGNAGSNVIDYDIEDYGNGWYRCYFTAESVTTSFQSFLINLITSKTASRAQNSSIDGQNVEIYGAQLEAGSYPTSYIPTYGTSASRAADSCNSAGDSSTFNSEGVLFVETSGESASTEYRAITISDGTSSNRVQIWLWNNGTIFTYVVAGGTTSYSRFDSYDVSNTNKIALKYKANEFSTFINGTKTSTDLSGSAPSGLNDLSFNDIGGTAKFFGKPKQVLTFPTALTDAECIALTTI